MSGTNQNSTTPTTNILFSKEEVSHLHMFNTKAFDIIQYVQIFNLANRFFETKAIS